VYSIQHYVIKFFSDFPQSVVFSTNLLISKPVRGEVYSIQHYVIKFFSDFPLVGGFLRVLRFPTPLNLTATLY